MQADVGSTRQSIESMTSNLESKPLGTPILLTEERKFSRVEFLQNFILTSSPNGLLALYLAKSVEGRKTEQNFASAFGAESDEASYIHGFYVAAQSAGMCESLSTSATIFVSNFPDVAVAEIQSKILQVIHRQLKDPVLQTAPKDNLLANKLKHIDDFLAKSQ